MLVTKTDYLSLSLGPMGYEKNQPCSPIHTVNTQIQPTDTILVKHFLFLCFYFCFFFIFLPYQTINLSVTCNKKQMIASLEVFGLLNRFLCWYLQKLNLKLIHSSIIIIKNKLTSYILGLPQTNITGDMKANFSILSPINF